MKTLPHPYLTWEMLQDVGRLLARNGLKPDTHIHVLCDGEEGLSIMIGDPTISVDIDTPLDEGRYSREHLVELHEMMRRPQDLSVKRDYKSVWLTPGAELDEVESWIDKILRTASTSEEFRYVKKAVDVT